MLGAKSYTEIIFNTISSVLGNTFEDVCTQYLILQARKGKLPFIPNGLGKWWGNNPKKKPQDNVDIIGIKDNQGIFCECKFRNEKFDLPKFNDLICASEVFSNISNKYYYVFVKADTQRLL